MLFELLLRERLRRLRDLGRTSSDEEQDRKAETKLRNEYMNAAIEIDHQVKALQSSMSKFIIRHNRNVPALIHAKARMRRYFMPFFEEATDQTLIAE